MVFLPPCAASSSGMAMFQLMLAPLILVLGWVGVVLFLVSSEEVVEVEEGGVVW